MTKFMKYSKLECGFVNGNWYGISEKIYEDESNPRLFTYAILSSKGRSQHIFLYGDGGLAEHSLKNWVFTLK